MREVFVATLTEICAADPSVVLLTGDLGFGVLDGFRERFPRQFVNAGVAEQNLTALAAGLALSGRIAFTYSIGNFPTLRCLEFLRNDALGHGANVKVVSVGAGFSYGALGSSHWALEDLAVLRAFAGVTIFTPGDAWEAAEATRAAARTPGVVYLRLDKSGAPRTPEAEGAFAPGRMRRLREGRDAALFAAGGILGEALAAADRLAAEGLGVRVWSVPTLAPFDAAAVVGAARETGVVATVEEHGSAGGLAGAVAEALLDAGVAPRRFVRFAAGRTGADVGDQEYLRRRHGLDAAAIAARLREAVRGLRLPGSAAKTERETEWNPVASLI
jgi:transketolase